MCCEYNKDNQTDRFFKHSKFRNTEQIPTPLLENLSDERNKYRSFLQDSALCNIFRDQIISIPLLTAYPSNLTCDYYLWGSLKVFIKQTTGMGDFKELKTGIRYFWDRNFEQILGIFVPDVTHIWSQRRTFSKDC
jgi:hypothetical protein